MPGADHHLDAHAPGGDRILGDRDPARMGLEIAERNADADLQAKIDKLRETMDREIDAAALVAELLAS